MSETEVATRLAIACGLAAYVWPLFAWRKETKRFPPVLLLVPALTVTSWWMANSLNLGPVKIGFTFYGAIVAALASNLLVAALERFETISLMPKWASLLAVTAISVLVGLGLFVVLPGWPE